MDSHFLPQVAAQFQPLRIYRLLVVLLGIIFALFIVIESLITIRPKLLVTDAIALADITSAAPSVDIAWHAPNATKLNNLSKVFSDTGVYGFTYDNSYPVNVPYGTYNWCNMPHVRKQEYKKPSKDYTLKYVEVIHRHHKRTLYASNSFPIEPYGWNCDDEALFIYGQPDHGNRSAHTNWHGYISSIYPFESLGFTGSCQFPQITKEGLDDSWQHGRDLYEVYHDLLNFLPEEVSKAVEFRVTQNHITSQVAGVLINGMFNTRGNIALLVAPPGYDSLEPTYGCSTSSSIYDAQQSSTIWTNHLTASSSLYNKLDNISGVLPSDSGFHASFDHYYDNLSARQCHAKPLPCKIVNGKNSTTCVTQAIADEVYRLGHWEYSYIYRDAPTSLSAAVGSFGVWIAELASHIRDSIAENDKVKYRHNVAHDGSISRLLSFLQIDVMVWPGMGAEVVFEMYENSGKTSYNSASTEPNKYYLRVLFGGKVLQSSSPTLGVMDMVPLGRVLAYIDGLVGVNAGLVTGKCNGTISF